MFRGFPGSLEPPPFGGGDAGSSENHNFRLELSEASDDGAARAVFLDSAPASGDSNENSNQADTGAAKALDAKGVASLVSRADSLPTASTSDFSLREGSKPAPKSGERIEVPFPAAQPPREEQKFDVTALREEAKKSAGKLEVLRYTPQDGTRSTPLNHLTVTFNQPMVDVSAVDDVEANVLPVTLNPLPPGNWKWLGTQTLRFDAKHRFPKATVYNVRVKKGIKSVLGAALERDVSFRFTLTEPRVLDSWPKTANESNRVQSLQPLMWIRMDQKIDPLKLVDALKVKADGNPYKGRAQVVTAKEAGLDDIEVLSQRNPELVSLAYKVQGALDGEHVLFRWSEPLPANATIIVMLEKGFVGAEGPRPTTAHQTFQFKTYAPFAITKAHPPVDHQGNDERFPPGNLTLFFNNSVDKASVLRKNVSVTPSIPEFRVQLGSNGQSLYVVGASQPMTKYTIELKDFVDVHGQQLVEPSAEVRTGKLSRWPSLSFGQQVQFCDPKVAPAVNVEVGAFEHLRVRWWHVTPEEYNASPLVNYRSLARETPENIIQFGKKVFDKTMQVNHDPNKSITQVPLALQDILQHPKERLGMVFGVVEPTKEAWEKSSSASGRNATYERNRPVVFTWVVASNIAVDAITYNRESAPAWSAWVTRLEDGSPVSGASVSLVSNVLRGTQAQQTNEHGLTPEQTLASTRVNNAVVVARLGNDVAIMPRVNAYKLSLAQVRWVVFDDRKLYKPKETITVKGYVREVTRDEQGVLVSRFVGQQSEVKWSAKDARNAEIATGSFKLNQFGAFDFNFVVPDTANLGAGSIHFTPSNKKVSKHYHQITLQEFRRPEYEISADYTPKAPQISAQDSGSSVVASVNASYFSGGPLSGARVQWQLSASTTTYSPPNWSGFTFGRSTDRPMFSRGWLPSSHHRETLQLGTWHHDGETDGEGAHRLKIEFSGNVAPPKGPTHISIDASATVYDLNNQAQKTSTSFIVHPASLFVGVKKNDNYGQEKQPVTFDLIVCDGEGDAVAQRPVVFTATRSYTELEADASGISSPKLKTEKEVQQLQSGTEPIKVSFTPKAGGTYTFSWVVLDDADRVAETTVSHFYVKGSGNVNGNLNLNKRVSMEEAGLILNKETYEVGDEAELLVQAPFAPASGLLRMDVDGHSFQIPFRMKEEATLLRFKVQPQWVPNARLSVDLTGAQPRTNNAGVPDPTQDPRPAFAHGSTQLSVSKKSKRFTVTPSTTGSAYKPGDDVELKVSVKRADSGEAVSNAEVVAIVVDESVLALTGYTLPDPLETFCPTRGPHVNHIYARQNVVLITTEDLEELDEASIQLESAHAVASPMMASARMESAPMGNFAAFGGGGGAGRGGAPVARTASLGGAKKFKSKKGAVRHSARARAAPEMMSVQADAMSYEASPSTNGAGAAPIAVRSNFAALANFTPSAVTNAAGETVIRFKLPDSLTRYRIWAVAATESEFGLGESSVQAKLPLSLRPSLPRFLNFGDRAELSLVLTNQTDKTLSVKVAAALANLKFRDGFSGGYQVELDAGARAVLTFPVETLKAGTAQVQFVAAANDSTDASVTELPVYTPATTEAFATYGDIASDKSVVLQSVRAPSSVEPSFGALSISTSSTALQSLTDALLDLYKYPFDCTEQVSSKILGVAALKDVLNAFKVEEAPSDEEAKQRMQEWVGQLESRQFPQGGWGWWTYSAGEYISPYLTVHAFHALAVARNAGLTVSESHFQRAKQAVTNIAKYFADYLSQESRRSIKAYSFYALKKAAGTNTKELQAVASATKEWLQKKGGPDTLNLEALGWLLSALGDGEGATVQQIVKKIYGGVEETAETAHLVTDYGDDGQTVMLHSSRRTDAIVLEGLLSKAPTDTLNAKLAKGLLAHKVKGAWKNTQENVYALLGLRKFFDVYEKDIPDFELGVWLGQAFVGDQTFKGRTTHTNVARIPMSYVLSAEQTDIVLQKEGKGRLYYRFGLTYAPADLRLLARNYGFQVTRKYEAMGDAKDVQQDEEGRWLIKLGSNVRVTLTLTTSTRRYHVALVDPLPAGLEAINPALKGSIVSASEVSVSGSRANLQSKTKRSKSSPWSRRFYRPFQWFQHQNLRDERAEAFTNLMWSGEYTYQYVARATTAGTFVTPPAKAEEMYAPEVFGRTATDFVVVKEM